MKQIERTGLERDRLGGALAECRLQILFGLFDQLPRSADLEDESSGTAGSMAGIAGSVRRLPSAGVVGDGVGHGLSGGAAGGIAAMGGKGTAAKPSGKGNQSEGGKAMPQKFPETSSSTPT